MSRLVVLLLFVGTVAVGLAETSATNPGSDESFALGAWVEMSQVGALASHSLDGAPRSVLVNLTVRWEDVEPSPGVYDWSSSLTELDRLRTAGYRIAVRLAGPHRTYLPDGGLPRPAVGDSLAAWLRFVRGAVRTFGLRVDGYQVWEQFGAGSDALDPVDYAFLLKNSSLAIRAEARKSGLDLRVAQAAVDAGDLAAQRSLWEQDIAPYVDVIPVRIEAGRGQIGPFIEENVLHPPASRIWGIVSASPNSTDAAMLGTAIAILARGADAAIVDLRGSSRTEELANWITGADRLLAGTGPAPLGSLRLQTESGSTADDGRVFGRFLSDTDLATVLFYLLPGERAEFPSDRLRIDSRLVRETKIVDPRTGTTTRVSASADGVSTNVRVYRADLPLVLQFRAGAKGVELPPEEVETTETRELTAEEIIARHQTIQREQSNRLERFMARGRVTFHFKLAQSGSSVDVTIDSNYFWERGGRLEWEQTDYYINGNRVRWKSFPKLPLIQPEKVLTVPLDLTLDRTYAYRLIGRDTVNGREAYLLEFQPADPDAPLNLYRGRIWIDVENFVRSKASLIQTHLESPVLSNQETDRFEPQVGPDGELYSLLTAVKGQQTWSTAGRTFVVRREMTFSDFEINPSREEFESRRQQAYASTNRMMADTDKGFRYLDRMPDGTREIKDKIETSQTFVAVGAFKDGSTDGVSPLGGVNYFNYDLWGKNVQVNAFFAGVLGFFTASKPDLFGSKMSFTVDAFASAIKFQDKVFFGEDELLHERIESRPLRVAARVGLPAGQYWRFNLIGGFARKKYFENDEALDAIAAFNAGSVQRELQFALPQDHTEVSGSIEVEFNRKGLTLIGQASSARRSDWAVWGLQDRVSGEFGSVSPEGRFVVHDPETVEDGFTRWGVTGFREWFVRDFQKLRAEINYLDGSRLDRYSRYEFSQFGSDRLFGFSGSGVRFDRGLIARSGYSFNIFEAIRLDGVLETARVRRDGSPEGTQQFTGVGLSGNTVGPWKTVISLNYGYAIDSDIPDLEGESEFLLIVLKLF